VRAALGVTRGQVIVLTTAQGIRITVVGVAIGAIGALAPPVLGA